MKSSNFGISKRTLFTAVIASIAGLCVYRPLPEGFTAGVADRFAMHLIEPVLRVTYYFPADKLCPHARCRLTWTRAVLNVLTRVIDPRIMFDTDPHLHLATEHFNGVKVRTYVPDFNRSSDGAVFFVHGGGFVIGNTEMYEGLMRRLTKMLKTVVVSVDYRLAPEAVYPGGLLDVEMALDYFLEHAADDYAVDPAKVVVMGDSAGGNLVAALTQRMRNRSPHKLAGQVLLYPLLQFHDLQTKSYRHFHRDLMGFALVDPVSLAYYYMWYAGIDVSVNPDLALAAVSNGHVSSAVRNATADILDFEKLPASLDHENLPERLSVEHNADAMALIETRLLDPSFAPLVQRNLTALPKSLVVTCEFDILRDEGALYALRMKRAGVDVDWVNYENGFHAMLNFHNELYIAQESLADIVRWTASLFEEL